MFATRAPLAFGAGTLCSGALFLGLWQLVNVPFDAPQFSEGTIVEFTRQIRDTPPENKRDPKVTREPRVLRPGPTKISFGGGDGGTGFIGYEAPRLDPVISRGGPNLRGIDGDVLPMVRPPPDYPPRAAAQNIEGWVQVQFAVTAAGTVRDALIVASEPGTVFDEAALKAIARWRYNPRVVDGAAVERIGLQTIIRFELEV
jgi:protein TonB